MRENDIVFFNLHRRYLDRAPDYGGFLGIYILAAFVNENGYRGQAFEGTLKAGLKLVDELCQKKKIHILGLYCDYANVTENQYISQYVKGKYGIPVFVGGPQATSLKADFMCLSKCDVIVRYEGELTVLELMDFFLDGTGTLANILGIAYCMDNKFVVNPNRPEIENLDALPFISDECYLETRKNQYELSIMTGRGCPFHCSFCHEGHHTRKVRFRSIENVLAEIDMFIQSKPPESNCYILFTDDTFTLDEKRVHELCKGLKERRKKHNFIWFCEGHIHTLMLHQKMINDMAEAGLQRIQLGIEAGTQQVLDAYHKNTTLEEIKEVVQCCRDAGIQQIYGNIILGSAFFSKETYAKDLAFGKELLTLGQGSLELGIVSYWPLPETSITESPEKYSLKIIDPYFFTSIDDFPQTETQGLTCWDILLMMQQMEKEFSEQRKRMLRNGEVPLEKIISWYPKDNVFKSYGMWWQTLIEIPSLYAYAHLISLGEAANFSQIEGKWENAKPMRVLPLSKYLISQTNGSAVILGVELCFIECEALVFSTGRITILEIYQRLKCLEDKLTFDKLKQIFFKLEKSYLIVYLKE